MPTLATICMLGVLSVPPAATEATPLPERGAIQITINVLPVAPPADSADWADWAAPVQTDPINVPAPATGTLMLIGLSALAGRRRRRPTTACTRSPSP